MKNQFWKSRKVLVTGSTGFIGAHLTNRLVSLGADVTEFVHEKPSKNDNTEKIYADLLVIDSFKGYLKLEEFDTVFHLAAQPIIGLASKNEYDTLDLNIRGAYNLLSVLKTKNLGRYVHISTDKVYGNQSLVLDDSALLGLGHPYNLSKLCGDNIAYMYASFYGIPTTIIRNANIYGGGDLHFDRIVPRTVRNLMVNRNPVIRGDGSNLRDYIYIDDIVDGYILAAESRELDIEIFNFGADTPFSVRQIIDTICNIYGSFVSPVYELQMSGEIPNQHIDNSRVRDVLGWFPKTSLIEGIRETIDWYKENI